MWPDNVTHCSVTNSVVNLNTSHRLPIIGDMKIDWVVDLLYIYKFALDFSLQFLQFIFQGVF